jgi:ABC-type transport system involved in multi-copper enzyme maturation permease subunit
MSLVTIARVALGVFRESIRDRVLYTLVLFAVLLIGVSYLIGQLTAGQDIKIIKDLGLAAIAIFGLMMAVFIGVGLVWKEVDRRSIYSVLSKPVRRHEFVAGKYCGLALTLVVNVSTMTTAYYLVLAFMAATFPPDVRAAWPAPAADPALLKAIGLITLELLLVTAIAVLFSTFSSPFLSAMLTLAVWVIGTFNADLNNLEAVTDSVTAARIGRVLYYVLPNFSAFDVKMQAVHGLAVPWSYVGTMAAYAAVYVALLLVTAVAVFSRRDFK